MGGRAVQTRVEQRSVRVEYEECEEAMANKVRNIKVMISMA